MSSRSFGYVIGAVMAVGAVVAWWAGHVLSLAILAAGALLLIELAARSPARLDRLASAWRALSHALGWLNLRVVLLVAYLVFLIPVGLVRRAMGRDPLRVKRPHASTWEPYPTRYRDASHVQRLY
jgi:hypothetical protein